jgi:hypothetical protein
MKLNDGGVLSIAADDGLAHSRRVGPLPCSPRDSHLFIGRQQDAHFGIGCHNGGHIPTLGDNAALLA